LILDGERRRFGFGPDLRLRGAARERECTDQPQAQKASCHVLITKHVTWRINARTQIAARLGHFDPLTGVQFAPPRTRHSAATRRGFYVLEAPFLPYKRDNARAASC